MKINFKMNFRSDKKNQNLSSQKIYPDFMIKPKKQGAKIATIIILALAVIFFVASGSLETAFIPVFVVNDDPNVSQTLQITSTQPTSTQTASTIIENSAAPDVDSEAAPRTSVNPAVTSPAPQPSPQSSTNSNNQPDNYSEDYDEYGPRREPQQTASQGGQWEDLAQAVFKRRLTAQDVEGLPVDQAAIIRNSVYARAGYIFSHEPFKSHFEAQPWYSPNPQFREANLTTIEKENVRFLLNYERGRTR